MIRITDVSFAHGAQQVLNKVDLTLEKGGITALVGANGAGKSTLLSLIARLTPLQTGHIQVDDMQIGQCATDLLAKRLAILPQSSDVAPRLTVRDLVGFGRYPHHKGRPGPVDADMVESALSEFDLHGLADRQLDTLSGGQRQRAQVAMTFAQDTDYLLLDEPLNNLDLAASRALMQTLQRLAHDHGKTIIVVLHDLNYASRYADQLVALHQGQIAAQGHPAAVLAPDFLETVFATRAEVQILNGRPMVQV